MTNRKKIVVVGTGAGGATIANKLQDTCDVTMLEQGRTFKPFSASLDRWASLRKTGLLFDERMIQLLIPNMQIRKSESMIMVNGIGIGGTTTLATGNAVRTDEHLAKIGVNLDAQFEELYRTLPITTEHQKFWNPATREMFAAFQAAGLDPQPTPKFLRTPRCVNCGHCAIGCPTRVKWDTRDLVQEAQEKGAELVTGCRVNEVLIADGEATGVRTSRGTYTADAVILAAGGFGTPLILEASGIPCEQTLFVDPVLCVAAERKGFGQDKQLLMPFFTREDGYMLSPYVDYLSFFFDKKWRYPKGDIISLMVKMADDSQGATGRKAIHKTLTAADEERLQRGVAQCQEIMGHMGIRSEDTFLGIVNAGHPGGMLPLTAETAASLHDPSLPDNLYLADATIFPWALGLPPILTIMALALKVAEKI